MGNKAFVAVAMVFLALAIAFATLAPQQVSASTIERDADGTYLVDISDSSFSPSILNISVGDTVRWTNRDSVTHSVTSDTVLALRSAPLGHLENFTYTFETAGTYKYHCGVHSSEEGTITAG
jgi:plastocyanin